MDWFETLFGFSERDWQATQDAFELDGETLRSKINGALFHVGRFSTPTLASLREAGPRPMGPSTLSHIVVDDVFDVVADPTNAGDLFQVASQFNTLEFAAPHVTPEAGVTGYAYDATQGPACALAAAPATVFRNYFAPLEDSRGQRAERQINNLASLEQELPNGPYWHIKNGYSHSSETQLVALNDLLRHTDIEFLKGMVRIGLQQDTDVVFASRYQPLKEKHRVRQAFCSAISCGYTSLPNPLWQPLACLVLDAAYEATLLAAAIDRDTGAGSGRVWLTMLGGGVFGNDDQWICDAIEKALERTRDLGLDIRLAHFRSLHPLFSGIRL